MRLQLNFKSGKPPYRQIVDQIKAATAAGSLRAGEALPPIRTLAEQLRLNRNTVAKAYAELEHQGIIENAPGRGCFVRDGGQPLRKDARRALLAEPIDALIVQAHHVQIQGEELIDLIRERQRRLGEGPS
ncbi:MAG: GntR family transcriptional regulator [Verrucomicrobiae bacterium]|nr:GntR family transcriptional regulator [Verrucomicrobiae bacterium]